MHTFQNITYVEMLTQTQSRSLSPPWIPDLEYSQVTPKSKTKRKEVGIKKMSKELQKENTLAVLGTRQDLSKDNITDILNILLENLPSSKKLDKIIYPSEGISSIHIETWADNNKYKTESIESDWKLNGKSSRAIRDKQIEQQGKYFLIFVGPRSLHYRQVADRIIAQQTAKNEECIIFIQPYSLKEPIELLIVEPSIETSSSSDLPKECGRTSNKKRGRSPHQSQKQGKMTDYLTKCQ